MKKMEKQILGLLLKKPLDFWRMATVMGYLPDFVRTLKRMKKENLLKIKHSKLSLTKKGKDLARTLKLSCQTPPFESIKEVFRIDKKLAKDFKEIRTKISYKTVFDQLPLSIEGIMLKIETMKKNNDLAGKKIICLGDDDFFALALALTKLPSKIAVLDIDKEILAKEKEASKKTNYKIKTYLHNLLEPLPTTIKNQYDVFVTEPPDTVPGLTLFFSRGVECLKKEGGVGYLGICTSDISQKQLLKIEKNILSMGAVITDIYKKIEMYETIGDEFEWIQGLPEGIELPSSPWFCADLFRVEILSGASPLIKGKAGSLYRDKHIQTIISC